MSELKPCPFCGGEAKVSTLKWGGGYTATALCKNEPNAHYLNTWDEDEVKAVERITAAWNTRHVETCQWEYPQGVNGWVGYAVCSSCGERFDECVTDIAHYCPNCGRKVEG